VVTQNYGTDDIDLASSKSLRFKTPKSIIYVHEIIYGDRSVIMGHHLNKFVKLIEFLFYK
jgi:hypothetical protein